MTPIDDRDPVDVLAEEFVDRLRRGEHPSVSDYAAAHPDHAEQLRDLLPAVAQMEYLKRFRRTTGQGGAPLLPDRFGDFRIVRELGRGGMGVVFEAVQESLGRPVALKVLATHSQLDGIKRERFIREAHAAARLHHTNIVPVFGVGEQDGILPYYVMQLIRGQGLNTLAHRWRREQGRSGESISTPMPSTIPDRKPVAPSPPRTPQELDPIPKYGNWRFVAEVGLQAAEALHYAHKQGVLHRDIKPANLLLDSSSRVWITDFGLAKVIDLNGITASGDILGTLQYVAPECLTGDSDPRSDVYGVGATLYELLTLIPPYPADSPARLLKQVADTDPVPPRQLNPDIPLDLETIVLKAMAREPDHRYITARELARDLQAFLEDRQIKARRQTWSNRMWRWCRRNPAIAILSPTVVAALVLAAVAGWVGYAQTQSALNAEARRLNEAVKARQDADKARKDLDANLRLSLAAFEQVFDAASANRQGFGVLGWGHPEHHGRPGGPGGPGPGGPGGPRGPDGGLATDAQAKMLEAVLRFYDEFAKQNATNPQLQLEAAKAHRRVGEARMWLGQTSEAKAIEARASFSRAIGLLKALRREYTDDEEYNQKVDIELAQTYMTAPSDTPEVNEEALMWSLEVAHRQEADPLLSPYLVGWLSLKLGSMRDRGGNRKGAETAYLDAIAGLSAPEGDDNRPPPVVTDQASARYLLAMLLIKDANRLPEARKVLTDLIAELLRVPDRCGRGSFPQQEVGSLACEKLIVVCQQMADRQGIDYALQAASELKRHEKEGFGWLGGPGGRGGPPGGPKGGGPPPPHKN